MAAEPKFLYTGYYHGLNIRFLSKEPDLRFGILAYDPLHKRSLGIKLATARTDVAEQAFDKVKKDDREDLRHAIIVFDYPPTETLAQTI